MGKPRINADVENYIDKFGCIMAHKLNCRKPLREISCDNCQQMKDINVSNTRYEYVKYVK